MTFDIFLDNQIGLFDSSKNRGIRRYFNSMFKFRSSIDFKITTPILSMPGSSFRKTIYLPRAIETYAAPLKQNLYWNKMNQIETHLRSKSSSFAMPTFYFPEYLQSYINNKNRMVLPIFDLIPELFADKYPELLGSHASIRDYTECAEVILCISEETKQDLLICWPNLASKNIVVSEPLFELPSAEVFLAATSQKPRTKSKLLNLIHVGERFYYKNFVEVAHAVINAKTKTSLRVLGGGIPSAAEIKLAELARENGNSIKFLGSVNQKELDSEYKNADFTVIGSEKEGFGYAFVESLTRGTPVIAKAPNMWSNIPLVLSQESLNFDSDYILGFREDSMNHLELLSLWEVLNYKILNSINTFNSLKSQL